MKKGNPGFVVNRDRDGLEPLVYTSIEPILEDYKKDIVGSANLPSRGNFVTDPFIVNTAAVEASSRRCYC